MTQQTKAAVPRLSTFGKSGNKKRKLNPSSGGVKIKKGNGEQTPGSALPVFQLGVGQGVSASDGPSLASTKQTGTNKAQTTSRTQTGMTQAESLSSISSLGSAASPNVAAGVKQNLAAERIANEAHNMANALLEKGSYHGATSLLILRLLDARKELEKDIQRRQCELRDLQSKEAKLGETLKAAEFVMMEFIEKRRDLEEKEYTQLRETLAELLGLSLTWRA